MMNFAIQSIIIYIGDYKEYDFFNKDYISQSNLLAND